MLCVNRRGTESNTLIPILSSAIPFLFLRRVALCYSRELRARWNFQNRPGRVSPALVKQSRFEKHQGRGRGRRNLAFRDFHISRRWCIYAYFGAGNVIAPVHRATKENMAVVQIKASKYGRLIKFQRCTTYPRLEQIRGSLIFSGKTQVWDREKKEEKYAE